MIANIRSLTFHLSNKLYALCRLNQKDPLPDWVYQSEFRSVTRTGEELSIVCDQAFVPFDVQSHRDYCCLRIGGQIAYNATGILAAVTKILAEAKISVFAISTYDTEYIFFQEGHLKVAIHALEINGHAVIKS